MSDEMAKKKPAVCNEPDLRKALDRSNRLIERMAKYIGSMALDAEFFRDLNEHGIDYQKISKQAAPQ